MTVQAKINRFFEIDDVTIENISKPSEGAREKEGWSFLKDVAPQGFITPHQ